MPLTATQQRVALETVSRWRAGPQEPATCPACGHGGLVIIDRSARPHAEWYGLSCPACGLSETLHLALGAVVQNLD